MFMVPVGRSAIVGGITKLFSAEANLKKYKYLAERKWDYKTFDLFTVILLTYHQSHDEILILNQILNLER